MVILLSMREQGTDQSTIRRALAHFEKCLEMNKAIGYDEGIVNARSNLAAAKKHFEGFNVEEMLKAFKNLYELRVIKMVKVMNTQLMQV